MDIDDNDDNDDEDDAIICLNNSRYTNIVITKDVNALTKIIYPVPKLKLLKLPDIFKFVPLATSKDDLTKLGFFGTILLTYNIIENKTESTKLFLSLTVENLNWQTHIPILKSTDKLPIPQSIIKKLTYRKNEKIEHQTVVGCDHLKILKNNNLYPVFPDNRNKISLKKFDYQDDNRPNHNNGHLLNLMQNIFNRQPSVEILNNANEDDNDRERSQRSNQGDRHHGQGGHHQDRHDDTGSGHQDPPPPHDPASNNNHDDSNDSFNFERRHYSFITRPGQSGPVTQTSNTGHVPITSNSHSNETITIRADRDLGHQQRQDSPPTQIFPEPVPAINRREHFNQIFPPPPAIDNNKTWPDFPMLNTNQPAKSNSFHDYNYNPRNNAPATSEANNLQPAGGQPAPVPRTTVSGQGVPPPAYWDELSRNNGPPARQPFPNLRPPPNLPAHMRRPGPPGPGLGTPTSRGFTGPRTSTPHLNNNDQYPGGARPRKNNRPKNTNTNRRQRANSFESSESSQPDSRNRRRHRYPDEQHLQQLLHQLQYPNIDFTRHGQSYWESHNNLDLHNDPYRMLQPLQPRGGPEPLVPTQAGNVSEARADPPPPPATQEKEDELISIAANVTPTTREAANANASGRGIASGSSQPPIGEGFNGNGIPPNIAAEEEVSNFVPRNLPPVIIDELDNEVFLPRNDPPPPEPQSSASGNAPNTGPPPANASGNTDNTATTASTVVNETRNQSRRRLPNNIADLNNLLSTLTAEYSTSPSDALKDQLEAVASRVSLFEWQSKPLAAITDAKNNLEQQINATPNPEHDLGLIRMAQYRVLCQLEQTAQQELGAQQAQQLMVLDRTLSTSEKIHDLTSLEAAEVTSDNAHRQVAYYLSLISTIINPEGQTTK